MFVVKAFFQGCLYPLRGLALLKRPKIRSFVIAPLLVNLGIFSIIAALGLWGLQHLATWIDSHLPSWLHWIEWVINALLSFLYLLATAYTFTTVANIIAAPLNSLLAEQIEFQLTNSKPQFEKEAWWVLREIGRALLREWQKLCYYLPRTLVLLLISFIPLLQLAAPILGLQFNAWVMAIQYMDYPMDNHRIDFPRLRQLLAQQRVLITGFGLSTALFTLIPVVNILAMPAAVAGSCLLWVEVYLPSQRKNSLKAS